MIKKFTNKAEIFSKSDNFKQEYSTIVVVIGDVVPIEGSDFLATTIVDGTQMVVRKDQVKSMDVMFYAQNETMLNKDFLGANNLFDVSNRDKNANFEEVSKLLDEGKNDEANKLCGYFSKHGRVRMIRLKGEYSMGFLFSQKEMANWVPEVADVNMNNLIGVEFDTVNGELFCKAYVPPRRQQSQPGDSKLNKRNKRLKRFNRIVDGSISFHYDTQPLHKNMCQINPTDNVIISNKLHGTSAIFAHIEVKNPKKLPVHKKMWNWFCDVFKINAKVIDYTLDYDVISASRTVIKNQYINTGVNGGYYGTDLWSEWGRFLKAYIPEDMTVYGEICGYVTGSDKMIQKGYDYGCDVGENFFMPYRIVSIEDGKKREWNVSEVNNWTVELVKKHPELAGKIRPETVLYSGTLQDLYPEIDTKNHWHENVLAAMRKDVKNFGMEKNEPECKNKVPREGIVLRIEGDIIPRAFKLKAMSFANREAKLYDAEFLDDIEDIEVENGNY